MTTTTTPLFGAEQTAQTSDDYYTPRWVFERMGLTFDVDVCAPPGGVPWIPAGRYYSKADDGLAQEWTGRVWMNPPFSRPAPWVDRFRWHRNGVALLPFAKSQWFERMWRHADAIAYPGVRLSEFAGLTTVRPGYGGAQVFQPCALFAYGAECVDAIGKVGRVR